MLPSLPNIRYSVTIQPEYRVIIVDKTSGARQQRYREQISKGTKKRLQLVIDRDEAMKLDEICSAEGINKTEFIRRCIDQWSGS